MELAYQTYQYRKYHKASPKILQSSYNRPGNNKTSTGVTPMSKTFYAKIIVKIEAENAPEAWDKAEAIGDVHGMSVDKDFFENDGDENID